MTRSLLPHACPICGAVDEDGFDIRSKEAIIGHALLTFDEDGTVDWEGSTDVVWNTSTTLEYFCTVCLAPMPEELQQRIDDQLMTQRVRELPIDFTPSPLSKE